MNDFKEFIKATNGLVLGINKKIEEAKKHLSEEQKIQLENELSRVSKDMKKATDKLTELQNKL